MIVGFVVCSWCKDGAEVIGRVVVGAKVMGLAVVGGCVVVGAEVMGGSEIGGTVAGGWVRNGAVVTEEVDTGGRFASGGDKLGIQVVGEKLVIGAEVICATAVPILRLLDAASDAISSVSCAVVVSVSTLSPTVTGPTVDGSIGTSVLDTVLFASFVVSFATDGAAVAAEIVLWASLIVSFPTDGAPVALAKVQLQCPSAQLNDSQ